MNERIKQLAQEAGMYVDLNGNPWPKWMSAEECELAYKKFAELIVRECMDITKQCSTGKGIHDLFADEIIAQHFGVE
jgi:hypothetical protein